MMNEELWNRALSEIELNVSRANFATWFKGTHIIDHTEGVVTIGVPSGFVKDWLETKYHKDILKSIRTLVPEVRAVSYSISSTIAKAKSPLTNKTRQAQDLAAPLQEQLEFKDFYVDPITNLNPRYTFDTLVVGSFNELAYTAALAVVDNLGKAYNPLLIYGGVGLGKTHLIQAIGNNVKTKYPQKKISYITSEKFSNEVVSAILNNSIHSLKEKYRDVDLLIVDDVQFFSGKVKTQEEFFYTFNALYELGKQVVFSSDRPPKSISDIEERLRSRLEVGMFVDISAPEYETRLAILKSKSLERNINLPDTALEIIATMVQKNIRELEGALNVINMQSKHRNGNLSIEEIRVILNKNSKPKNTVTPLQIIKIISEFYDIQEKLIYERTRKHEIVKPRQIAMYLIREDLQGSFPYIGQKFGGRDHTTAMHAHLKVIEDLKKDSKLEEEIRLIREKYQTS